MLDEVLWRAALSLCDQNDTAGIFSSSSWASSLICHLIVVKIYEKEETGNFSNLASWECCFQTCVHVA